MSGGGMSEPVVEFVAETNLPTLQGEFRMRAYRNQADGTEPIAMVVGDVSDATDVFVRVHDACATSEIFMSSKCDCREQLAYALQLVQGSGRGVVIYLFQEGRGIGLANKVAAYALQEQGMDTVDANRHLGLPDDARSYAAARDILADLGVQSVNLLTNNPRKIDHLTELGVIVSRRTPVLIAANPHNVGYLKAKRERMAHLLPVSQTARVVDASTAIEMAHESARQSVVMSTSSEDDSEDFEPVSDSDTPLRARSPTGVVADDDRSGVSSQDSSSPGPGVDTTSVEVHVQAQTQLATMRPLAAVASGVASHAPSTPAPVSAAAVAD